LLSLLSFVALIILIYTFYLMFFSEDGKWFDKVKSNLKGLLLWFVFLWLSWIIVSFIFNFYEKKILQDNAEITMESDNKI
jgi:NADH:ubiquinone oxidoreductase subunit 6 (subunit J)